MPITNVRQGSAVRVAVAFQTAQGVPVTAFVDNDILRADEAPAPNPNVIIIAQTGSTGSPYEQDEGVNLVGITPEVDVTVKVSPQTVRFFTESLLGVVPTETAGPLGTLFKFEGFVVGIPKFATYIWDTTFETVRASDLYFHTMEFNSRAAENLVMAINGTGFDIQYITPAVLAAQQLINFDTYSHKESILEDVVGGTSISLLAMEQTLRIEQARIVTSANSIAPNFIGKDGRITVTGTIRTRLYDDTIPFFIRELSFARSNITMRYVQQDGKTLVLTIRNATTEGTVLPRVGGDGTLEDYSISFTARQKGDDEFPITIEVED